MVALTNGTADPANFKILPLPFRLDEMRHMTVTDHGASIVLSYAGEDGQEHVLCTVVSGPNAVLVLDAENTVVFQKEEALLPAGKIDFTAFGSVSAIDNLTVSVNQAIGLYEISENHQITPAHSLGEGRFALSLPKLYGMENYMVSLRAV